ncbi:transporter substrate-binding domain-containing protein [Dasania sp. GY-MA-18]|uniref:Transporter substrate-binding domain-containing protein n=1 Tax=Dasania phycosphaerae TaxID=2950436 RepID=A0A9J6RHY9_9GAMM|nr:MULTISPECIES: transporter substrate-binding domain-containing protein [Dasania]MCR8921639.1 transporter substrate-binding domain-containing protein [Dasania sp. GY-MA-18]MCZ0864067.1 transporter substrate-binding domain-containing protein [Dasania phycosphaerae]MCZ0867795.1 transporter substrate-binding domain-containing protein [Dasania phycosphaerae]
MRYLYLGLMLWVLSFSPLSSAATITIVTDKWDGYSNADGSGYYLELMKAIYSAEGVEVSVKQVPYARSMEMVATNKADVVLGIYPGEKFTGTYAKHPLNIDIIDAALTPAFASTWVDINSLADKKVGAVRGWGFDAYVPVKMRYKEYSSLKPLLKMLNNGRVDAVLATEVDIKASASGNNFVIKKAVIVNSAYAVFASSNNAKKMLAIFDAGIVKLHDSGQLRAIMTKNLNSLESYPFQ